MRAWWLVVLILSVFSSTAGAQAPPPPPKHEATAEAAFVGVTGNASSSTFGLGGEVIARPGHWTFRHKASFIRNEAEDVVTAKSFAYAGRAERSINTRVSAFGEYAFFRDRFAGVDDRNSVLGGVSLKAVTSARQTLGVDLGAGYLNERRVVKPDISNGVYTLGSAYALKLSSTADLRDDLLFLGSAKTSTDWRLAHTIALTARVTDVVSLKVSNTVRYVHFPPVGFKTTDTTTAVALVAKFPAKK
jgi:putative salt-induced outer membrane protein YdiY